MYSHILQIQKNEQEQLFSTFCPVAEYNNGHQPKVKQQDKLVILILLYKLGSVPAPRFIPISHSVRIWHLTYCKG